MPSIAGTLRGNSITVIDPQSGIIGRSVAIGSEPNQLALSDNSQYVYVGLNGAAAVRRFDVAAQTAGLQFAVGGSLLAEDIEVLPGQPDSVAISRLNTCCSPRHAGVAIYDNGVQRTQTTSGGNVIAFGDSASTLYGHNNETSGFGFYRMAVTTDGVSLTDVTGDLINYYNVDIIYADGRIYTSSGAVIDPTTRTKVGQFAAGGPVAVDPASRRVYFVEQTDGVVVVHIFHQDTSVLIDTVTLTGVSGQPGSLVRWGTNRLAFLTRTNIWAAAQNVVLVDLGTIGMSTFADVPTSYWAWDWVETLYINGITSGCAETPLRYCPDDPVSRAQMAVFLLRGKYGGGYIPPAATGTVFADVPATHWAAAWIEKLYAEGITTGCGAEGSLRYYCPETSVTRAQMAVFLLRARTTDARTYTPPPASDPPIFADVPSGYWAGAWIEKLYADGITTGCATNPLRYCPEDNVNRAQMAVFLVRTFNLTRP